MASSPSVSDTKPQQAADLVLVSSAQLSAVSAALKDAERRAREDFPGNRQIREWLRSHRKSVFAKVKRNCVVIEERDQRRKQQLMEEYQSLESELKVLQSRLKRKRREVPLMYAEWANQEIKDAENQADRVEDMEDLEGMAEYEADKKLLKSKIEELAKTCEQIPNMMHGLREDLQSQVQRMKVTLKSIEGAGKSDVTETELMVRKQPPKPRPTPGQAHMDELRAARDEAVKQWKRENATSLRVAKALTESSWR